MMEDLSQFFGSLVICTTPERLKPKVEVIHEALLGVIGIRDIWVKNYRDTGYLGGKLKGYGIFLKRFWDIEVIIF